MLLLHCQVILPTNTNCNLSVLHIQQILLGFYLFSWSRENLHDCKQSIASFRWEWQARDINESLNECFECFECVGLLSSLSPIKINSKIITLSFVFLSFLMENWRSLSCRQQTFDDVMLDFVRHWCSGILWTNQIINWEKKSTSYYWQWNQLVVAALISWHLKSDFSVISMTTCVRTIKQWNSAFWFFE